jgi:hypothetical protein
LDALSQSNDLEKQTSGLIESLKSYWVKGGGVSSDVKKTMADLLNECKAASANAMEVVLPKLTDLTKQSQSVISDDYQNKYRVSIPELTKLPIAVAFQVQEMDRVIQTTQTELLPELSKNVKELINKINELNTMFGNITQALTDAGFSP